jgi:hypothetical protein
MPPPSAPKPLSKSNPSMYKAHPEANRLSLIIPATYVSEARDEQRISWRAFVEMRECIQGLAALATAWKPDLVLFFATGASRMPSL